MINETEKMMVSNGISSLSDLIIINLKMAWKEGCEIEKGLSIFYIVGMKVRSTIIYS